MSSRRRGGCRRRTATCRCSRRVLRWFSGSSPSAPERGCRSARWTGIPVDPSEKQGSQRVPLPKAKALRPPLDPSKRRAERSRRGGAAGRDPDVVRFPCSAAWLRVATYGSCPKFVGSPDPGDGPELERVEDVIAGAGLLAERALPGNERRGDVVAVGVPGRGELVGAAVEQLGCAGLLADLRVCAGVRPGRRARERREGMIVAFGFVARVFGDESVVVGRAGCEPRKRLGDVFRREVVFELASGYGQFAAIGDGRPVFDAPFGEAAARRDFA